MSKNKLQKLAIAAVFLIAGIVGSNPAVVGVGVNLATDAVATEA